MMNTFELDIPGGKLTASLRRSPRAGYLRLRIRPDGSLEVVLPYGVSRGEGIEFATSHLAWIVRTLRKIHANPSGSARTEKNNPPRFPAVIAFDCLGGSFAVRYEWLDAAWTAARLDCARREILLSGHVLDPVSVREALTGLLLRSAEKYLFPRLLEFAASFGFRPGKLAVRIQKGRWGSCSSRGGNISLNALLLLLPPEIADYVLIHELCHLRHMNHSDAFWEEVKKYVPDCFAVRRRLGVLGKQITKYFYQNE